MVSRRVLAAILPIAFQLASPSATSAEISPLDRQRLIAHLEMTGSWVQDELAGLSPSQLSFRPAPDSWSILEVLDHLVVVGSIYWNDLQAALKTPLSKRSLLNTDADLLWYGIDRTSREKAIPTELPKGQPRALTALLDDYRRNHARLLEYAKTTKDELRNFYVARQGCDAYQWALLISTHEQRHILQIREIKRHPRFPRS